MARRDARRGPKADQRGLSRRGRGMEMARRPGVGALRHHLHRRDLQGCREADLRQGRRDRRPRGPVQREPRRQRAARHRYPRGRDDQREGVQGAGPRRRRAECGEGQGGSAPSLGGRSEAMQRRRDVRRTGWLRRPSGCRSGNDGSAAKLKAPTASWRCRPPGPRRSRRRSPRRRRCAPADRIRPCRTDSRCPSAHDRRRTCAQAPPADPA